MSLLVIGPAALDRVLTVDRLPQAGQSVLARSLRLDVGGRGANQAVAAARAGARVRLLASIGADPAGERIRATLAAEGVETGFLLCEPKATPQSLVFVLPGGEKTVVAVAEAAALAEEHVTAAMAGLGAGDRLLVSGHLDREGLARALGEARIRGLATAVNLAPVPFPHSDLWPLIDLVIANAAELALHAGEGAVERAVRRLLALGVREVLVTLGAEGALLASPEGEVRVPAPTVAAVDTTGAGDLLAGIFLALRDRRVEPERALAAAVAAAARKVRHPGTLSAFPQRAEIAALLGGSD
ncbi:Ribokinase [bacterium HR40]|nr:Ribokinase [bacterium HR40]